MKDGTPAGQKFLEMEMERERSKKSDKSQQKSSLAPELAYLLDRAINTFPESIDIVEEEMRRNEPMMKCLREAVTEEDIMEMVSKEDRFYAINRYSRKR